MPELSGKSRKHTEYAAERTCLPMFPRTEETEQKLSILETVCRPVSC